MKDESPLNCESVNQVMPIEKWISTKFCEKKDSIALIECPLIKCFAKISSATNQNSGILILY